MIGLGSPSMGVACSECVHVLGRREKVRIEEGPRGELLWVRPPLLPYSGGVLNWNFTFRSSQNVILLNYYYSLFPHLL